MSAAAANLQPSSSRVEAGRLARVSLGVLLIVAAIAKGVSSADSAAVMLRGWPFAVQWTVVEAELVFGALLVCGVYRKLAHYAALVIFTGFALFALRGIIEGEKSCGCFGAVAVDPHLTLLVDLAAIVALVVTRPTASELRSPIVGRSVKRELIGVAAIVAVIGVPLGITMANLIPTRGSDAVSAYDFVLLEPETWVGKQLPLLNDLGEAQRLMAGEWTVLMHNYGCADCERVRPRYENRLDQGEKVLLVETPPFSGPSPGVQHGYARLPDDREWFVQTPVEIVIRDGVVMSVNRDLLNIEGARL
jgi:hypothetical protein